MSVKYEIHHIANASGTGGARAYAHLFESEPMTAAEQAGRIQQSCTLTEGDVAVVLSALRELVVRDLSQGRRFHVPGIGYLSLSVRLSLPDGKEESKVRAGDLRVRGLNFRPDAALLAEVRRRVCFEKSDRSALSAPVTEDGLRQGLSAYLSGHRYVSRRIVERMFSLRPSAARRWLALLVSAGFLVRGGAHNSPVYFLGETAGAASAVSRSSGSSISPTST